MVSSPKPEDAQEMLRHHRLVHEETDFLASYPEENHLTVQDEIRFIQEKNESDCELQICAFLAEGLVGMAGFHSVRQSMKMGHRAELAVSVEQKYWGLGIGTVLMTACIENAKQAGCLQLELEAVADNVSALGLYRKMGFIEYGRNPRGLRTKDGAWQELVLMRLEL